VDAAPVGAAEAGDRAGGTAEAGSTAGDRAGGKAGDRAGGKAGDRAGGKAAGIDREAAKGVSWSHRTPREGLVSTRRTSTPRI